MKPFLSILLFDDCEKPIDYLRWYFAGLRELNRDATDDIEIHLISQRADATEARKLSAEQPFPVTVYEPPHPHVGTYPIWDVLEECRLVWPNVKGTYVTFNHTEFFWCPKRLKRTLDELDRLHPYIALGNLLRPGLTPEKGNAAAARGNQTVSDALTAYLDAKRWKEAAEYADRMPAVHWVYWEPKPTPGGGKWQEDMFFVKKDWMDAVGFFAHGGRQPFQDVYDLMRACLQQCRKYGYVLDQWSNNKPDTTDLVPNVERMSQATNRVVHIHHPRHWAYATADVRDFFLADPETWRETKFLNVSLWEAVIRGKEGEWMNNQGSAIDFRFGPGGTVTRYLLDMGIWMRNGGMFDVDDFYVKHGRHFWEL